MDLLNADPELTQVFYDGLADFGGLSHERKRRFITFLTGVMRRFEDLLYEIEDRRVDPDAWLGIRGHYVWLMSQPGFIDWWNSNDLTLYNRQLRSFVADVTAENTTRAPT